MARGDQLSRQWQIIQRLLNSRVGVTVHDLADALGCHRRTIYRDLEALQAAGFPLVSQTTEDGRSRWAVLATFRTPMPLPVEFTEIMALYFGRRLLAPLADTPYAQALDTLFAKLSAMMPDGMDDTLGRWAQALVVGEAPHKNDGPGRDTMDQIHRAIVDRRTLAIDYYSMSRRQETRRRIDPYHLLYMQSSFYLVAHCRLRKAIRMFAVDRIQSIKSLDSHFKPPEDFDIGQYLAPSFGAMVGQPETVIIEFDAAVAGYIAEKTWHPSQKLIELDNDGLRFTADIAVTEELISWICQWGSRARVVAPAHLAERLQTEAQKMALQYASPTSASS